MNVLERLMQTRNVLAVMALLQLLWLVTRWLLEVLVPQVNPHIGRERFSLVIIYSILVGVAVSRMPASFLFGIRQLKDRLLQNEVLSILTLCVSVGCLSAVYANYKVVAGDELLVFKASRVVAEEGVAHFFGNYASIAWLGPQHPPLVPLIYGFTMHIIGANLFVVRLVSLVLMIVTIVLTYCIARKLYDKETAFLAVLALLSFRYFLSMGAIASNDMPLTFFFVLALFLTARIGATPTYWLSMVSGISVGLGLLTKYTMVLVYPVILIYFTILGSLRRLRSYCAIVVVVSAAMLAAWLLYAEHIGAFVTQRNVLSSYAKVVITTSYGKELLLTTLLAKLPSAVGVYHIPMLFLGATDLMRRRSQSDLFILLWIGVVFLSLSLTLPDHRYFMPAFPALAIMVARGLRRLPEAAEQVIMLALLYCGGVLYLFVDWHRAAFLFFR